MANSNYPRVFAVEIDKDYGRGIIEREEIYVIPTKDGGLRYFIRHSSKIEQIDSVRRGAMTWQGVNEVRLIELTEEEIKKRGLENLL